MSEHDEKQEEVVLKVIDRRKFNSDGSLKDGVELEPAPAPKPPAPPAAEPQAPSVSTTAPDEAISEPEVIDLANGLEDGSEEAITDAEEELPGIDDPASFINFLSSIATNAAAALGAVPHPATGQRSLDLETGKHWLDVIAMLKEKTAGNLHSQEARLIDGLLADLRMQYVTMVRATEEKLKADAAKKFSGEDILGRKS